MRIFLLLMMMCSMVAAPIGQEASVSGTWSLKAEAANGQTHDGGTWSRSAVTGVLVLEQNGTALKGTWTGPRGDSWPFSGRIQGTAFEFRTDPKDMSVTIDGRQTAEAMRWTFRGTASGDTLKGQMALHRDGREPEQLQPFTADRRTKNGDD